MRKWILVLFTLLGGLVSAQENVHHVESGETLYSISREYGVTIEQLIEENPILSQGLKEGQDIVIPGGRRNPNRPQEVRRDSNRYDYYTVKPQETIYSLTREWGISYEDLLELNPELERGLKVDQVLKLPKGTLREVSAPEELEGFRRYRVRPMETIYSLVRALEWSEEELYEVNPEVEEDGLKAGLDIWIPEGSPEEFHRSTEVAQDSTTSSDTTTVDEAETVSKYMVIRTERNETWESLERRYRVTKEELIRLNPELLARGVQPNRNLIVPRPQLGIDAVVSTDSLSTTRMSRFTALNDRTVKVAIALPLFLAENDSLARMYNMGEASPQIYGPSRFGFDFYMGLRMAMDSLLAYGLDVEVEVFDTRNDANVIREIADEVRSSKPDILFGPLYGANAEQMAELLPEQWIVSPLSRTVNNGETPRLIQAVSSIQQEHLALARWVNENAEDANVIFVRRDLDEEEESVRQFIQHLQASEHRNITTMAMGESLFGTWSVRNALAAGKRDVFVILDTDPVLLTSFVNSAASANDSSLTVLSTSRLLDVKTLEIEKLNELNLHISDVEYLDYRDSTVNVFLGEFRKHHKTDPPRFAVHGFDVGMYFLPIFSFGSENVPSLWYNQRGIIKAHDFNSDESESPSNRGTFLLRLNNYNWEQVF